MKCATCRSEYGEWYTFYEGEAPENLCEGCFNGRIKSNTPVENCVFSRVFLGGISLVLLLILWVVAYFDDPTAHLWFFKPAYFVAHLSACMNFAFDHTTDGNENLRYEKHGKWGWLIWGVTLPLVWFIYPN